MFELQIISKGGSVYLKRWRIFGYLYPNKDYSSSPIQSKLPFALRIHKFERPDDDKFPHNHPWKWALSFIFKGGYSERVFLKDGSIVDRQHYAPCFNFIRHDTYHMVTCLHPKAWTLFLTGPKVSSWGFLVDGVHVEWKKFLGLIK